MTNAEEVFDDIMSYTPATANTKFHSQRELREYIKNYDRKDSISPKLMRLMLSTDAAQERIIEVVPEKNKGVHPSAQDVAALRRWRNNPSGVNVQDFSHAQRKIIEKEISDKIKNNKTRGYTVARKNGIPVRVEKGGRLRNIINGRFVSKAKVKK